MKDETNKKIISALKTFASVFILALAAGLSHTTEISWALTFWTPLVIAAVRAGVSAVIDIFVPVRLGGKKG